MDSFLGTSDPSMLRIEVLGDLFLLMTVRTTVTEVAILGRKFETRQVVGSPNDGMTTSTKD